MYIESNRGSNSNSNNGQKLMNKVCLSYIQFFLSLVKLKVFVQKWTELGTGFKKNYITPLFLKFLDIET